MAKRATTVFAAAPIVQGRRDGTGTPDILNLSRGSLIAGSLFYANIDDNQGSLTFRITPEWNGNDNLQHDIIEWGSNGIVVSKRTTNALAMGKSFIAWYTPQIDISGWVAGTTYNVCVSWDSKNTLDGTNYIRISINDVHTFGQTTPPSTISNTIAFLGGGMAVSAIIEGLTVYRRVLYDGAYGVNVGNGDEVALIAAGVDPCTVTGSWDVCFCLPTNATPGALVTGTGEAWSHPHGSNLLTRGWLNDRYYGGGQWGVKASTSQFTLNCGSDAGLDNLADNAFTIEGYILTPSSGDSGRIVAKTTGATGWQVVFSGANNEGVNVYVYCATTPAYSWGFTNWGPGTWHNFAFTFDDAGTRLIRIWVDGKEITYGAPQVAGVGAIISDAAENLIFGKAYVGVTSPLSTWGWWRVSNIVRYVANFVPSRTPPALPDANTIAQWNMTEGTGAAVDNAEGTAARDGTITAGVWEPQFYAQGTPIIPYSVIGSTTYRAVVTDAASIQNLHDGAMTAEGWFRIPKNGVQQTLFYKGAYYTNGWGLFVTAAGQLYGFVTCATTYAEVTGGTVDGNWHLYKMTFDDGGDRKIRIYIDDVLVVTSAAGVGLIISDIGITGIISRDAFGVSGAHGWVRWSNVLRAIAAPPIPRSNPPASDGNTVGLWLANEGAGAVLTDSSAFANNGAMAGTYSWNTSPAMESDSPGARVYAWGYVFGNDAVDEGFKQTWVGLTAGANYVLRALAYSEEGVGQPELIVYDETNAAVIATITGTVASTERAPDLLMCSFELPTIARYGSVADCVSISIIPINTAGTGVVGWQQIELYANLLDNPSFDVGPVANPWIPSGWATVSLVAGDSSQGAVVHGGGLASLQLNAGCNGHGIRIFPALVVGKFYTYGVWAKRAVLDALNDLYDLGLSGLIQASQSIYYFPDSNSTDWKLYSRVFRAILVAGEMKMITWGLAVQNRYIDDAYVILMDDVTLTCTPTSAANSVESGGLRVDGWDTCTQPIPANRMFAIFGWSRVRGILRHDDADVLKFGNATPTVCEWWGDANNYIYIDWSAANTLRLTFRAAGGAVNTGTWVTGGVIAVGTSYLVEIIYTAAQMVLMIDGVVRVTIAAATGFITIPATFYGGSLQAGTQQGDLVLTAP
jgi:hypothetical protein